MSDDWGLRQAVMAAPDDDLPRLVYADWLDDAGDGARADFVRAQVQLASAPPWEPFAVRTRHRRPEFVSGGPWRGILPALGEGKLVDWHAARPFRRGFGWCIHIRQMGAFLAMAPEIFAWEPVGELILPSATRDDWTEFASAEWLSKIKALRFTTGSVLSEPIRALAASPFAGGIESIAFEVSTSPGMAAVVELLLQSPLAKQLKQLEFCVGHDREGEILQELCQNHDLALEKLTLAVMGQGPEALEHLNQLPNPQRLTSLTIKNGMGNDIVGNVLRRILKRFPLRDLTIGEGRLDQGDTQSLERENFPHLQRLDLYCNYFLDAGLNDLCEPNRWQNLRSLSLKNCGINNDSMPYLSKAAFWQNLVELDLRNNRFDDDGARQLLAVEPPRELAALLLSATELSEETQALLRGHFGECVIFETA